MSFKGKWTGSKGPQYLAHCHYLATDGFNNFRNDGKYCEIVGRGTPTEGEAYAKFIKEHYPFLL